MGTTEEEVLRDGAVATPCVAHNALQDSMPTHGIYADVDIKFGSVFGGEVRWRTTLWRTSWGWGRCRPRGVTFRILTVFVFDFRVTSIKPRSTIFINTRIYRVSRGSFIYIGAFGTMTDSGMPLGRVGF